MHKNNQLSRHRPAKPERCRLSFAIAGDAPPTEFRIFKAGVNDSQKGSVLFDDLAAKLVMSSYKRWGIDLAIDLEHGMVDVAPGAADPTARDARGWCKLEVRNGELWAVDVRWTPDGIARLTNKTQRYISPCFDRDAKTKRVVEMFNIALTAIPATNQAPALVAANRLGRKHMAKTNHKVTFSMDSDTVMKALESLEEGDMEACKEILKALIASAASGEEPGADDGAEGDGAEGVATPSEGSEVKPKEVDSADPGDPEADPDEKDEKDPEKKEERKAMRSMLRTLTGSKTFGASLSVVQVWRKSHLELETERTRLAAERAVLESAERRSIAGELVTLGAEFPATIFVDPLKPTVLKQRWTKMPIAELRSHLADQKSARKGQKNLRPPTGKTDDGTTTEIVELSATDLQLCKQMNCDPKEYARLKGVRIQDERARAERAQAPKDGN
jgi:Mu-like prophage I protein